MREKLKDHIKAVLEGIRHLSVDDAADLIAETADEIAEGGPDDLINGAILDGIRWGYTAAVQVEMGCGAMVRIIQPGGFRFTEEWADVIDAQPQIDAALNMLSMHRSRRTA